MFITFKTITQQSFKIDFDLSLTIGEVKKKISEEKGDNLFPVDAQKLIYNGKILLDEQKLEDVNICEKKFVVVMVSKKKTEVSSASSSSAVAESKVEQSTAKPLSDVKIDDSTTIESKSKSEDVLPNHEEVINAIQNMGYPREEVISALKKSFYDPDRAVEYLCNGIPDDIEQAAIDGDLNVNEEHEAQGLDFLQNNPQFQQVRELVRSQPHLLHQIVQQIAENNPFLMDAIRNNQNEFLQLLNAPPSNPVSFEREQTAVSSGQTIGGSSDTNVVSINVSENDRSAIQRLMALGFAEQLVIEAYFACDKNEDLAANYILARMDEMYDESVPNTD